MKSNKKFLMLAVFITFMLAAKAQQKNNYVSDSNKVNNEQAIDQGLHNFPKPATGNTAENASQKIIWTYNQDGNVTVQVMNVLGGFEVGENIGTDKTGANWIRVSPVAPNDSAYYRWDGTTRKGYKATEMNLLPAEIVARIQGKNADDLAREEQNEKEKHANDKTTFTPNKDAGATNTKNIPSSTPMQTISDITITSSDSGRFKLTYKDASGNAGELIVTSTLKDPAQAKKFADMGQGTYLTLGSPKKAIVIQGGGIGFIMEAPKQLGQQ